MALIALIVLYVIWALIIAYVGRYRRMGFIGTFLLSLLITPLLMMLVLAMTGPARDVEWRAKE